MASPVLGDRQHHLSRVSRFICYSLLENLAGLLWGEQAVGTDPQTSSLAPGPGASASSSPLSSAGRGYGCAVTGATAALRLLHPGCLPAASPTASATATTSTCVPAATTAPPGVCGPPPRWHTAAQCQPDAGAPAATTLSHCTIHSSPVPCREPRPASDGD